MGRVTRGIYRPTYMTRDTALLIEMLNLDDSQGEIVTLLLEAYDANLRMAAEESKAAMGDLYEQSGAEDIGREQMDELRGRMDQLRAEAREMRQRTRPEADGEGQRSRGQDAGTSDDQEGRRDRRGQQDRGEMTEEQRAEADARRAERQSAHEEFRARMRSIRDEFRSTRDLRFESDEMQDVLTRQIEILRRFDRAKRSMDAETAAAIVAILTPDQSGNWEPLDRRLRRMRMLPDGRLSGESTDLVPLVERNLADLDDEHAAKVQEIVGAWEFDIDSSLTSRSEFDRTAVFDALEAMQNRDFDHMLDLLNRRQRYAQGVRDVTDGAIDAVAWSLPEERAQEFRLDALRMGYRSVFRPARAQRAIAAAMELEDLDEDTLTSLAGLQQGCNLAIGEENEAMLKAVRGNETPREMRFVERMRDRELGVDQESAEEQDDPIADAREHRDEVDEKYLEALRDLLGEERVDELPGGRRRGQRGVGDSRDDRRGRDWGGDNDERRRQFMERFDANGDGEIDDTERAQIREYFQQMRDQGGDQAGRRGGRGGAQRDGGSGGDDAQRDGNRRRRNTDPQ